jgi:hypothetical protein
MERGVKFSIFVFEEEKAEKSNFIHKFYDTLPDESKTKKEESNY